MDEKRNSEDATCFSTLATFEDSKTTVECNGFMPQVAQNDQKTISDSRKTVRYGAPAVVNWKSSTEAERVMKGEQQNWKRERLQKWPNS